MGASEFRQSTQNFTLFRMVLIKMAHKFGLDLCTRVSQNLRTERERENAAGPPGLKLAKPAVAGRRAVENRKVVL